MGASRVKGITIEIDGDATGLDKALKGVNSSISDTQKQLRDVNKLLKLDPGNTELIAQKQRLLGEAINDTKTKLNTLKTAAEQANDALANGNINQSQYEALQREIIDTTNSLKKLEEEQKKIGADTSGLANFGNKCVELGDKMRTLSMAATAALAGITALAVKAGASADDLNTMAKQTGLSTDALQKMAYASDLIDVDVETITSSISKMKRSLDSQADTFAQIGVQVKDQKGQYRDIESIFYDTVRALGEIENETERDTIAMQLFGRSADQLAGILDDGGAALKSIGDDAENMGRIIPQETLDKANEFNDSLDRIKAALKADIAAAGTRIAAELAPAFEAVSKVIIKVADAFAKMNPKVLTTVAVILAIVAAAASFLTVIGKMALGINALITVLPAIGTAITGSIIPAILKLNAAIATFMANPVVLTIAGIVAALAILGAGIYAVVKNWDTISAAATSAANSIKTAWNNSHIGQTINQEFTTARDTVVNAANAMKDAFESSGGGIRGAIEATFAGVKTAIKTYMAESGGITVDELDGMINSFKSLGSRLLDTVSQNFRKIRDEIINSVEEAIRSVIDGIKSLPGKISEALQNLLNKVMEPFDNIINKAKTWGSDLVDNFAGGILGNNKAAQAAADMAGGIQSYVGFSEPEKGPLSNFHTYAPDMIDLWVKGIKDNMYKINEASINMAKTMNPATRTESTNNMTSSIDSLTSAVRSSLATSQSNAPTNVTVVLQGDANKLFRVVSQENSKQVRATGYHALA